jgi:hypothetical protein
VAELPTIWLDRQLGESRFDLGRFLPSYLRWYLFAFGRPLTVEMLAAKRRRLPDAGSPSVAQARAETVEDVEHLEQTHAR